MHRHLSLEALPRKVAELGYERIERSPRADFLDWWVAPRVYPERVRSFKKALKDHGVKIASLLPMCRWASPHEDERQAAVGFDGITTACIFAWEERADESGRFMRETMQKYVDKRWGKSANAQVSAGRAAAPDTNWRAN